MSDDTLSTILVLLFITVVLFFGYNSQKHSKNNLDVRAAYSKKDYVIKYKIDKFLAPIKNGGNLNVFSVKEIEVYNEYGPIELSLEMIDELSHTFIKKCGGFYAAGTYLDKDQVEYFKESPIEVTIDFINNQTSFGPFKYNLTPYFYHSKKFESYLPKCADELQ